MMSFSSRLIAIAAGEQHSLAIEEGSGQVWTWGYNHSGQLGDGGASSYVWLPVRARLASGPSVTGMRAVAAGYGHSLALKKDGSVWAWGDNRFGQLGDGTVTTSFRAVQVHGLNGAVAVAGGFFHSMAIRNDGSVWTWGFNTWGQLGDGTMTERHTPVQAGRLTRAAAIDGGYDHSLAAAQGVKG